MERSAADESDVALADLPSTSGAHWANRDAERRRSGGAAAPFRRPPAVNSFPDDSRDQSDASDTWDAFARSAKSDKTQPAWFSPADPGIAERGEWAGTPPVPDAPAWDAGVTAPRHGTSAEKPAPPAGTGPARASFGVTDGPISPARPEPVSPAGPRAARRSTEATGDIRAQASSSATTDGGGRGAAAGGTDGGWDAAAGGVDGGWDAVAGGVDGGWDAVAGGAGGGRDAAGTAAPSRRNDTGEWPAPGDTGEWGSIGDWLTQGDSAAGRGGPAEWGSAGDGNSAGERGAAGWDGASAWDDTAGRDGAAFGGTAGWSGAAFGGGTAGADGRTEGNGEPALGVGEFISGPGREIRPHRAARGPEAAPATTRPRRSKLAIAATVALTATVLLGGAVAGVAYVGGEDASLTSVLRLGSDDSAGKVATAPLDDRRTASFELVAATTKVTVRSQDLGDDLYRITAAGDSGTAPKPVLTENRVQLMLSPDGDGTGGVVEVVLSSKVTWQLGFGGGVDEQIIDFTGGRISELALSGGSRRVDLALPVPIGTVPVRVTGAIEDFSISSPAGNPVRVRVDSGAKTVAAGERTLRDVEPGSTLTPKGWKVPNRYDVDAASRVTLLTVKTRS